MATETGFALSELIRHTADELRMAKATTVSADPIMQFSGCEIELAVTVSGGGSAGLKFWVVDASAKVAREKVSKIKLSFGPIPGNTEGQYPVVRAGDHAGPPSSKRQPRKKKTSHG